MFPSQAERSGSRSTCKCPMWLASFASFTAICPQTTLSAGGGVHGFGWRPAPADSSTCPRRGPTADPQPLRTARTYSGSDLNTDRSHEARMQANRNLRHEACWTTAILTPKTLGLFCYFWQVVFATRRRRDVRIGSRAATITSYWDRIGRNGTGNWFRPHFATVILTPANLWRRIIALIAWPRIGRRHHKSSVSGWRHQ
jgi:hypothetical protein